MKINSLGSLLIFESIKESWNQSFWEPKLCGVVWRPSLDLALLWVQRRPVATALIGPLAWEPSVCRWCGPKKTKKKRGKKVNLATKWVTWIFWFPKAYKSYWNLHGPEALMTLPFILHSSLENLWLEEEKVHTILYPRGSFLPAFTFQEQFWEE